MQEKRKYIHERMYKYSHSYIQSKTETKTKESKALKQKKYPLFSNPLLYIKLYNNPIY